MKFSITTLSAAFLLSMTSQASAAAPKKAELAEFFGVSESRVTLECPQKTYSIEKVKKKKKKKKDKYVNKDVLTICLNKKDRQRRCEIAVHGIDVHPAKHNIRFQLRVGKDFKAGNEWQSLMQLHSFPDKGEAWRCPVMSMEAHKNSFRMFNRWDTAPLSQTTGYHCTGPDSSIQARTLFSDIGIKPGHWNKFNMDLVLSHTRHGKIKLVFDKNKTSTSSSNHFNDKRSPYLKFGIYKPTTWESGHESSCVQYRKVQILSD